MINIAHVYAYFGKYNEVKQALNDDLDIIESTKGWNLLSILLDKKQPNYQCVNNVVEKMLDQAQKDQKKRL